MSEHHPLVKALFEEIPKSEYWGAPLRALWLQAAASVFDLVYGKGEAIVDVQIFLDPALRRVVEQSEPKKSNVVAEPAVTTQPSKSLALAERNVGGRPKTTGPARPVGIPTNLAMALEAIEDNYGKAAATQILKFIRAKYWAEAPDAWTASLYDQVKAGKLARDGINFIAPKTEEKIADKPLVPVSATPKSAPHLAAAAPQNRAPENGVKFEFAGKSVLLHKKEFRVAEALRRAMGKGHLDYNYLANAGLAGERRVSQNDKNWCMEMIDGLRPKVAELELQITHSPSFGYTMHATAD